VNHASHVATIAERRTWLADNFGSDAHLPRLEKVYRNALTARDAVAVGGAPVPQKLFG
jgi:hypothetical protein